MSELRLSADEWLARPEYSGITVLNPDGWDRRNYKASWAEKLTKKEFEQRLSVSTCQWSSEAMKRLRTPAPLDLSHIDKWVMPRTDIYHEDHPLHHLVCEELDLFDDAMAMEKAA